MQVFITINGLHRQIFVHLLNNCMTWILFLITVTVNGYSVQQISSHDTMQNCFQQRTAIVHQLGKPVDNNYQAVCITSSVSNTQGL